MCVWVPLLFTWNYQWHGLSALLQYKVDAWSVMSDSFQAFGLKTAWIFCLSHWGSPSVQFGSVAQSCPTLCDPMVQHSRPLCPSPSPGVYSNWCPLSQWYHPTISSSVLHFSSFPQSFPTSGSFQMSQFFTSGSQNIGKSMLQYKLKSKKQKQKQKEMKLPLLLRHSSVEGRQTIVIIKRKWVKVCDMRMYRGDI